MPADHERFMREALKEAEKARAAGNMAVGSVIVRDGEILARGRNEVGSSFDQTAHAEAVAIRSLTTQRRQVNLDMRPDSGPFAGALLYATLEPCPMCCWLSSITGLRGIVVGARHTDLDVSFGQYTMEKLMALAGRRVELVTGILAEQCMTMVRSGPFKPGPR